MRRARGQSLIITVMIMLVVVLMVFFTFSVGERTRKKMRMQALADSAAYSSAVAEARAMNFYALSNRAIISNLVSVLSVSAHDSWMTWYEDMVNGTAINWWNIAGALHDRSRSDPVTCGPCQARLDAAADAAFNIAEWYAFAMPKIGGVIALSGKLAPPGLPLPWPPYNQPNPNKAWVLSGSTPTRVTFSAWPGGLGLFDDNCYNLRAPAASRNRATSGLGEAGNCEAQMAMVQGARGADWLHRQFHGKVDGDWCSLMNHGRRQHFDAAQLMRAQQLNVERELVMLLRGSLPPQLHVLRRPLDIADVRKWLFDVDAAHIDTDPAVGDGTESASGGAIDFYDRNNQTGTPVAVTPMAQVLARKVDPSVKLTTQSAELSGQLYLDSVVPQFAPGATATSDPVDPGKLMSHRDFDQMEFTARYPQWVFQRRVQGFSDHLLREENWRTLDQGAQRLASGLGTVTNFAWYYGNTKAMSVREFPMPQVTSLREPTMKAYAPPENEYINGDVWWRQKAANPPGAIDPFYVEFNTGRKINSWYTWRSSQGQVLVDEIQDETGLKRFGRNFGHGSHDWGNVFSEFQVASACANSCDDITAETRQWKGRNANWQRGDGEAPKGFHFFHGSAPHIGHRQGSVNQSTDHQYVGHMRFNATDQPDDLWNMPRTVVMLTQPALDPSTTFKGQSGRRPWDFDFSLSMFGDMKFKTINTQGDALSGNEMAAAASGLVYYHQPTRWEEPPNLWNPFWRAKLHPLRRDQLLLAGHPATTAAINALPPGAINE